MKRATHSSTAEDAPKRGSGWRVPRRKLRQALCRLRRRIDATRRIVEARELFARTGRIETLQQRRIFSGHAPVHGWLWQMLTAIGKATSALAETAWEANESVVPALEPACCILADFVEMKELSDEAAALSERLEALAWLDAHYNLYSGVVLPAPVPEAAKLRRRRAVASAEPIPSRRPRRRLLKLAVVVRRVTRGRAPPAFFSLSLGSLQKR